MASPNNSHSTENPGAGDTELSLAFEDSQSRPSAYTQAPVLVLSRTAALIDVVKRAAPSGSRVIASADLDKVADQLPTSLPGVLVIDAGCVADVSSTVTQLTQHFPELVVVVAGKSEDSHALMRLTAAGQIYRFLLTPLSHGQTKLTLEAAMTQHLELGAAANRRHVADSSTKEERKNYTQAYAILGAVLLVIIGGVWWFMSRVANEDSTSNARPTPGAQPAESGAAQQSSVGRELALADTAFAAGNYLEPPGESALDLYRSALSIDPNNAQAKAGIQQVANKILERAESALTAEKLEDAVTALEQVRDIEPGNSRLRFLDGQIGRERERLKLTQAQEVAKKVRTLLANASQAMEEGKLIAPAGNSARDAILEARRADPTDPSVAQSLRSLNARIVVAARLAAEQGHVEQAQSYLSAARQLGSAGNELSAVERLLAEARGVAAKRTNLDTLVKNARKRIAEGQLLTPAGDSARDLIASIRAGDSSRPELDELSKSLSSRLIDEAHKATVAKQYEQAQQLLAASRQINSKHNEAALLQAERELAQAQQIANSSGSAAVADKSLAPIQLKRTKTVTPAFPMEAKRKGISGWVEVSFLVTSNGTVQEAAIANAEPRGVFDQAALEAVQQWRFEQPLRDGKPATQRTSIRLRFDSTR